MTPAPLSAAELEELQIDAVLGALALLFVAEREERRQGNDRRQADRDELDRRAITIEELVDRA